MKQAMLVDMLKKDRKIRKRLHQAKTISLPYDNLKAEIQSFTTGAIKCNLGSDYNFDKAIMVMRKVQAYLDRLVFISSELASRDSDLLEIEQKAEDYLNQFDAVAQLRPAEVRKSVINSILYPIVHKRWRIEELKKAIEEHSWNLKHTYQVISGQIDAAKQVIILRNPERYLKDRRS